MKDEEYLTTNHTNYTNVREEFNHGGTWRRRGGTEE